VELLRIAQGNKEGSQRNKHLLRCLGPEGTWYAVRSGSAVVRKFRGRLQRIDAEVPFSAAEAWNKKQKLRLRVGRNLAKCQDILRTSQNNISAISRGIRHVARFTLKYTQTICRLSIRHHARRGRTRSRNCVLRSSGTSQACNNPHLHNRRVMDQVGNHPGQIFFVCQMSLAKETSAVRVAVSPLFEDVYARIAKPALSAHLRCPTETTNLERLLPTGTQPLTIAEGFPEPGQPKILRST